MFGLNAAEMCFLQIFYYFSYFVFLFFSCQQRIHSCAVLRSEKGNLFVGRRGEQWKKFMKSKWNCLWLSAKTTSIYWNILLFVIRKNLFHLSKLHPQQTNEQPHICCHFLLPAPRICMVKVVVLLSMASVVGTIMMIMMRLMIVFIDWNKKGNCKLLFPQRFSPFFFVLPQIAAETEYEIKKISLTIFNWKFLHIERFSFISIGVSQKKANTGEKELKNNSLMVQKKCWFYHR